MTQLFNEIPQLDAAVDWEVMGARMWANTAEDPDRMRRRMAEFLVHERFAIQHLSEIAVRTPDMKRRVDDQLAAQGVALRAKVRPDWYF